MNEALTWNELANLYDKANTGRKARTLSMNSVGEWAERQVDKFYICPKEGTIHYIEKGENHGS